MNGRHCKRWNWIEKKIIAYKNLFNNCKFMVESTFSLLISSLLNQLLNKNKFMACGGWESGNVDPSQIEARIRAGIEADRRYTAENSAKTSSH
ncbi:hypothetical protein Avbf_03654 [Armadillidium vulgare]|nr:hypothetical protein Avbf_03654 [Armadillidium vulgare]